MLKMIIVWSVVLSLLYFGSLLQASPYNSKHPCAGTSIAYPVEVGNKVHASYHPSLSPGRKALVTYYWPGETGGRYDRDGDRLHEGIAAVDFDVIPRGKHFLLTSGNCSLSLEAKDCGGSAVINRTASHARGKNYCVVDIWVPSAKRAREMEARYPSIMNLVLSPTTE